MDRFTNASEYERKEAQGHARAIAFGMATAVFSLAGIVVTIAGHPFSTGLLLAVLFGMAAWGVTYGLIYYKALPGEPVAWHEVEETVIDDAPPPQVNNGLERRQLEATANSAPIWTNNHLITVGHETVDLEDYQVTREQWEKLKKARRRGQLPAISLPLIHDVLGIDRKERAGLQDSDAHRLLGLLVDLELVKPAGDRRQAVFTPLGDTLLPYPGMTTVSA